MTDGAPLTAPRGRRFFRPALLGLFGIALLWIGLPRSPDGSLDNFRQIDRGNSTVIVMSIKPWGSAITLTPVQLISLVGILAGIIAIHAATTFPSARAALKFLRPDQRGGIIAILWGTLFLVTLIPGKTGGTASTWEVSFGLVWNFLGLAALGMALAPAISGAMKSPQANRKFSSLFDRLRSMIYKSSPTLYLGALSLFVLAAALTASSLLFGRIPHVQDSIAQLFHAKIFATGHLMAPIPAQREFFTYTHMLMDGGWYSQFPPGHSVLLLLGVLGGAPWAVNPLLGAAAIFVIYLLGREVYDDATARLAALLLALSPFVILMSSEFMNHASGMLMFSLFAWRFFVTARRPTFLNGALAGACLGWLIAIRPYSAAALAFPFLAYGLILTWKGGPQMRRAAIGACVTVGVFLGLLLLFNHATTGNALMFGYEKRYGAGTNPGFGHSAWGEMHTPARGMQQTFSNLNMFNKSLFEWPVPALLFCLILFASGRQNRRDVFLLLPLALVSFVYFFYWFQDLCFGPRYLYEAAPLIVLLSVRGIQRCVQLFAKGFGTGVERWKVSLSIGVVLAVLFIVGWSANLPPLLNEMANSYWRVSQRLVEEIQAKQIHNAVVFVSGNYGSAFPQNDPLLKGDVIYAKDYGPENTKLMEEYPGRSYFAYRKGILIPLR